MESYLFGEVSCHALLFVLLDYFFLLHVYEETTAFFGADWAFPVSRLLHIHQR